MGLITRVFEFDAAHRVMNEKVKCFNLHGHRWRVELTFEYEDVPALGYAIDFKEIKRVCGTFLDQMFDHAVILNPQDEKLIAFVKKNGWRLYEMGLGNDGDYNPSAENIASELWHIFLGFFRMDEHGIRLHNVRLYETPNCWVDCNSALYPATDIVAYQLGAWRARIGDEKYDIREV